MSREQDDQTIPFQKTEIEITTTIIQESQREYNNNKVAPHNRVGSLATTRGIRKRKSSRKVWHSVGQSSNAKGEARHGLVIAIIGFASGRALSIAATVSSAWLVFLVSRRLGPIAAAFVGLHATADGLGRNTSSDFDIWLLYREAAFDGTSSASAIRSSEDPFAISLGELVNRNNADASGIVTAVSGPETNAPSSLRRKESCQQNEMDMASIREVITVICGGCAGGAGSLYVLLTADQWFGCLPCSPWHREHLFWSTS